MKIAITGSHGFVGAHLKKKLQEKKISFEEFDRKKHNLLVPKTLKKFLDSKDILIHLAGINKDGGVKEMLSTNILGTERLMQAATLYAPNITVIYVSSFMGYVPKDLFGMTKFIGEDIIKNYCNSSTIKSIILRMSNMYGLNGQPNRNSVIATFIHNYKSSIPITIHGNGKQKRDFLNVEDGVAAIIKAIQYHPKKFETFDICTGKLYSLNDIITIIKKYGSKKVTVKYAKDRSNHIYSVHKNYQRAKKYLYWQPKISLTQGVKNLL